MRLLFSICCCAYKGDTIPLYVSCIHCRGVFACKLSVQLRGVVLVACPVGFCFPLVFFVEGVVLSALRNSRIKADIHRYVQIHPIIRARNNKHLLQKGSHNTV